MLTTEYCWLGETCAQALADEYCLSMRVFTPVRMAASVFDHLLDRLLCIAGAISFSQLPEFIQQYLQRLGGHLDEARRQLDQFRGAAKQAGMPLEQFATATSGNADPGLSHLGAVMQESISRVDSLAAADAAVRRATLLGKPFVFIEHLDPTIARATWNVFQPAVPTTMEGLVYAASGAMVLFSLYHLLVRYPVRRLFRARKTALTAAPI